MERLPDPNSNQFHHLIEQSNRLAWRSDQADIESRRLARHLAGLNADSIELIEHCLRLREFSPGEGRKPEGTE